MLVNLSGGWDTKVINKSTSITPGNILANAASKIPTYTAPTGFLVKKETPLDYSNKKYSPFSYVQSFLPSKLKPTSEVTQAAADTQNKLYSTSANPTILTPSSPLNIPPPYTGGGGGGSESSETTPTDAPPLTGIAGFWSNLSTTGKLGVVGGGLIVIYFGYKMLHKSGGRSAVAPKSEIKS